MEEKSVHNVTLNLFFFLEWFKIRGKLCNCVFHFLQSRSLTISSFILPSPKIYSKPRYWIIYNCERVSCILCEQYTNSE